MITFWKATLICLGGGLSGQLHDYRIVCNASALTRADILHLAGRHGKIPCELLEPNALSAAWHFTVKQGGRIEAKLEGRVVEVP